ncbi:fatty acid desaturase [bacterium]|nr:MAG: fatty acid desaturase [bacterium]
MINTEREIIQQIEDDRPKIPVGLLSRDEKDRIIERGMVGLYRWYVARSQEHRNWNPDQDFDWRDFRKDHSPEMVQILKGFFAVEQFVPDYVTDLLRVIRKSHGRSHFHIRWGAEEERHADLWYNALLFSGQMKPDAIRDYMQELRESQWTLPWQDPMYMTFYTVFQERATQVNYLNTAVIARGKSDKPQFANDADPILARAAQTIAIDEAAHYNFFLEGARLYLYYYPAQAIQAMIDVIRHFAMPGSQVHIPDYPKFEETVYKAAIYGPREHSRDVVQHALDALGFENRKALENGIKRVRQVPDENGNWQESQIFDGIDFPSITNSVERIFGRIKNYEEKTGHADIDPTIFQSNYVEL